MTAFELIVRPFQSRNVTPPSIPASGTPPATDNVILAIGFVGETKTFGGNHSYSQNQYMQQVHKEVSRETIQKDIKNPDDETQHVVVEDIKKLVSETGAGKNYQKSKYSYKEQT